VVDRNSVRPTAYRRSLRLCHRHGSRTYSPPLTSPALASTGRRATASPEPPGDHERERERDDAEQRRQAQQPGGELGVLVVADAEDDEHCADRVDTEMRIAILATGSIGSSRQQHDEDAGTRRFRANTPSQTRWSLKIVRRLKVARLTPTTIMLSGVFMAAR